MKRIIKKIHKYSITPPKKEGDKWSTYVIVKGVRKKINRVNEKDLETFLLNFYAEDIQLSYSVKDVYKHYLETRKTQEKNKNIKSTTFDYDSINWNRFLADKQEFINMQIKDVKPIHIERLCLSITGNGLINKTAFGKLKALLNGIFDEAVVMGIIAYPISRGCWPAIQKKCKFPLKDLEKAKAPEHEVYSFEDVEKLRGYLQSQPINTYTLAIEFATYFFLRIGELRALTWEDYNEDEQTLFIWHEIVKERKNGKARCDVDVPHTKGSKDSGRRYVPVPPRAAEILKIMRTINGNKKYIFHASGNAKFAISTNRFNEKLKKYCDDIGIQYHSSHKFRFYGISKCYEKGVPEHNIQYLAGHSDINTTRSYNRDNVAKTCNFNEIINIMS